MIKNLRNAEKVLAGLCKRAYDTQSNQGKYRREAAISVAAIPSVARYDTSGEIRERSRGEAMQGAT